MDQNDHQTQKPNQSAIEKGFQRASQLAEEQRVKIAIEISNDPRLQAHYEHLQANKNAELESVSEHFENQREATVESMTLSRMNDKREKSYLDYRPEDLPTVEQSTLHHAARHDAEAAYQAEYTAAVREVDTKYLERAQRLLEKHERLIEQARLASDFNQKAQQTHEHTQQQSRGRSL